MSVARPKAFSDVVLARRVIFNAKQEGEKAQSAVARLAALDIAMSNREESERLNNQARSQNPVGRRGQRLSDRR